MIKSLNLIAFLSVLFISCSKAEEPNPKPIDTPKTLKASLGIVGDTTDVQVPTKAGLVLMGGSTDVDSAISWMINRAKGGDVVVLRASGSTGYNSYIYDLQKENGKSMVNSVETFLINNVELANDADVCKRIAQAEMVFIAGGDQYNYVRYWKNTRLSETLNQLINEKKIPIGGTSAGCAILGNYVFTAQNGTVTSTEALNNPFDAKITLEKGFLNTKNVENVITDTHFDNPDRKGRLITFLARLKKDFSISPRAIGIDEATAVAIDENAIATIFGSNNVYFFETNQEPEQILPVKKLHWLRDKKAIPTYILKGTTSGKSIFDVKQWKPITESVLQFHYIDQGIVYIN